MSRITEMSKSIIISLSLTDFALQVGFSLHAVKVKVGLENARSACFWALVMSALKDFEDFIRDKIENERWTHKQISAFLEVNHPGQRGFSVRSVERFSSYKGIHKTSRIDDNKLLQGRHN